MGIRYNELASLLNACRSGAKIERVVTIGRQFLLISPAKLSILFNQFNVFHDARAINKIFEKETNNSLAFAENLLKFLGAKDVRSIDISDHESASDLHDLNLGLPETLQGKFDLALDFGTLEHIFDVPRALYNILSLVKLNGHYLSALPANNQMGHGFYQFSPEFFCSLLVERNGFLLRKHCLFEDLKEGVFYDVPNPIKEQRRVELCNRKETSLYVLAERIGELPKLSLTAYQSDYVNVWNPKAKAEMPPLIHGRLNLRTALKLKMPLWLRTLIRPVLSITDRWHITAPKGNSISRFQRINITTF